MGRHVWRGFLAEFETLASSAPAPNQFGATPAQLWAPKKSHVNQVILEGHDGYQIVHLVPLINHTCTYIHGSMMKIVDARALINVSQGCIPGIFF